MSVGLVTGQKLLIFEFESARPAKVEQIIVEELTKIFENPKDFVLEQQKVFENYQKISAQTIDELTKSARQDFFLE